MRRQHRRPRRARPRTRRHLALWARRARGGRAQQAALREDGVDLSRVIIGHVDWTHPDTPLDDFERLLDAGSYISFDTIGLDPQWPAEYGAGCASRGSTGSSASSSAAG